MSSEELYNIASKLSDAANTNNIDEKLKPLEALKDAAEEVGRSFSGSWLGYHAYVYYKNLAPSPPNANFSSEWGLENSYGGGSVGEWQEFDPEEVRSHIYQIADNPDTSAARLAACEAEEKFDELASDITSILYNEISIQDDKFLEKLKNDIEKLATATKDEILESWNNKGKILTRDMLAVGQGTKVPPHIDVLADLLSIQHSFAICQKASEISRKAASHIERRSKQKKTVDRIGTNVFIGHGQSGVWRELKDFVKDRLKLPYDEFNRVPVAGLTNITRLSEMLDSAAIAFLIMTAEDEMADGDFQARMNVVHEAGLFQGRLGFVKAIVLLEEGCEEFSNIQGLGQMRFPKGNIGASFEEIRRVLEREGLLDVES